MFVALSVIPFVCHQCLNADNSIKAQLAQVLEYVFVCAPACAYVGMVRICTTTKLGKLRLCNYLGLHRSG